MRKISNFINLNIIVLLFSSCTAIFLPNKQKINITTSNDDAVVYENDYEVGRGKNITVKLKKTGAKLIVVQTPGFKDEQVVILPYKRPLAFYPLYTLDFPTLIGIAYCSANKSFNYKSDWNLENTFKLDKKNENQKFIMIDAIKINLKDKNDFQEYIIHSKGEVSEIIKKAVAERANESKNNIRYENNTFKQNNENEKTIKETKYLESIQRILKKTEFIDTLNKVFQDNNNTIILEGEIRKVDIFSIYRKFATTPGLNKAGIGIQWYFKNTYNEIIDSVFTYEYSGEHLHKYINIANIERIYCDAVENNYLKMRQSNEFQQNIKLNTDFASKDEKLSILEPKAFVKEVEDATLASVIIKRKDKGHGSGFAISNDGYILTNFHVVAGKNIDQLEEVKVILSNGEELTAKVVRYNRACDIALLKVDYQFEKAFLLKSTKEFKNLQDVYTIGAPKSIELGQSVTMGIISNERKANNNNVLQLSMSINGGNSGGPLFDSTGGLHGVVQSKLVGYATEGVGFAIPSYIISDFLNITIVKK
ncbi:MAG: trypsin-like peptidase domain-containing protein [Fluviicola sp.]|nr:trypsin-like peptidase domain-containing protein [Fluviicola sp.]